MKNEIKNRNELGGSLPVENVQALASKDLKDIPAQYIRPELEYDVVCTDGSLEIPVIDLSRLLDQQLMYEELKKYHSVCEDWGFFQLINHGVPEEVVEKMKVDVEEFFKLPIEEKKSYSQLPGTVEGYGHAFVVSEEQKLDWGDMLFLHTQPVADRNMTLWPKHPTFFRATLDKYSSELRRVTVCLIGCMAKNLGVVDPEKFTRIMCETGWERMRMNYYPPCVVNADKVLGISPHSDASILTLLIQVNEVQGLQIRKNGNWVPVKPIPGAFIVNIGDIIEIMSNGMYKSIEHRVVVDPMKERMSIAAFQNPPHLETIYIGPLPEIVKMTGGEEKYKTLDYVEYWKLMYSVKLDGKNRLELMKLD